MKKITKETYAVYLRHSRQYWFFATIAITSIICTGLVDITVPLFYRQFFNVLSAAGTLHTGDVAHRLIQIAFLILFLDLAGWTLHRTEAFSSNHFTPRVAGDLANTCFAYLHNHSYGFFTGQFIGSLVRKVNRLTDAFDGITERMFGEILPTAVRVIAIIAILLYSHAMLGAILLVWVLIYLR